MFDTAATLVDVDSNFLSYSAPLSLFQYRQNVISFNLLMVVITSQKLHENPFSILAK